MSELPSNWEIAEGDDLFALVRGVTYSKSDASSTPAEGLVPILRANNIADGEIVTGDFVYVPANYVSPEQYLRPGDILIATSSGSRAVVGKAATANEQHKRYAFGAFCSVARPRIERLGEWLSVFSRTRAYRDYVEEVALGISINNLRGSDLKVMPIGVAPLPEQWRIVTKIDSLSAKSKLARDHLDHIPRLVEKYKQAILAAAFRGELTREWRKGRHLSISIEQLEALRLAAWQSEHDRGRARGRYSPPDDIDWRSSFGIPAGWTWASIDQLACLIQYGSSAKTNEDHRGIAVLRMGNIQEGKLDLGSLKYLPEAHSEFPELLLEKGDVLFNRTNSAELVGKTAVYTDQPVRASFASYLIRVRCCGLLPALLSGYVNSAYGRDWVANVVNQQVGQANVNGTKLRQLGVPVMPHEEQDEIVRRIEAAFAWIDRLAAEATSARKLIDYLDQAVLAKAFRGELVPQDPNDEPASVLLERIRAELASSGLVKRAGRSKRKDTANA